MANILIADDSKLSRNMLREILENLSHTVLAEACNGKELYLLSKEHTPDIILTDLEMPEMDGMAASVNILKNNPSLPIVLVTSITNKSELIPALKQGIRHVISKPYDPEDIKKTIEEILG